MPKLKLQAVGRWASQFFLYHDDHQDQLEHHYHHPQILSLGPSEEVDTVAIMCWLIALVAFTVVLEKTLHQVEHAFEGNSGHESHHHEAPEESCAETTRHETSSGHGHGGGGGGGHRHHQQHRNHRQQMLHKVKDELMVMGLLSFGLTMIGECVEVGHEAKLPFEWAHTLLFVAALVTVVVALGLLTIADKVFAETHAMENVSLGTLKSLAESDRLGGAPISRNFSASQVDARRAAQFQATRHAFIACRGLPVRTFNFPLYLHRNLYAFVTSLLEASPSNWCVVAALAFANLARSYLGLVFGQEATRRGFSCVSGDEERKHHQIGDHHQQQHSDDHGSNHRGRTGLSSKLLWPWGNISSESDDHHHTHTHSNARQRQQSPSWKLETKGELCWEQGGWGSSTQAKGIMCGAHHLLAFHTPQMELAAFALFGWGLLGAQWLLLRKARRSFHTLMQNVEAVGATLYQEKVKEAVVVGTSGGNGGSGGESRCCSIKESATTTLPTLSTLSRDSKPSTSSNMLLLALQSLENALTADSGSQDNPASPSSLSSCRAKTAETTLMGGDKGGHKNGVQSCEANGGFKEIPGERRQSLNLSKEKKEGAHGQHSISLDRKKKYDGAPSTDKCGKSGGNPPKKLRMGLSRTLSVGVYRRHRNQHGKNEGIAVVVTPGSAEATAAKPSTIETTADPASSSGTSLSLSVTHLSSKVDCDSPIEAIVQDRHEEEEEEEEEASATSQEDQSAALLLGHEENDGGGGGGSSPESLVHNISNLLIVGSLYVAAFLLRYAGVALGFEEADDRTRATLSQVLHGDLLGLEDPLDSEHHPHLLGLSNLPEVDHLTVPHVVETVDTLAHEFVDQSAYWTLSWLLDPSYSNPLQLPPVGLKRLWSFADGSFTAGQDWRHGENMVFQWQSLFDSLSVCSWVRATDLCLGLLALLPLVLAWQTLHELVDRASFTLAVVDGADEEVAAVLELSMQAVLLTYPDTCTRSVHWVPLHQARLAGTDARSKFAAHYATRLNVTSPKDGDGESDDGDDSKVALRSSLKSIFFEFADPATAEMRMPAVRRFLSAIYGGKQVLPERRERVWMQMNSDLVGGVSFEDFERWFNTNDNGNKKEGQSTAPNDKKDHVKDPPLDLDIGASPKFAVSEVWDSNSHMSSTARGGGKCGGALVRRRGV